MQLRHTLALAGALAALAGAAAAQELGYPENSYGQLNLGTEVDKISTGGGSKLNPGFTGSALFGTSYTSGLAFEVEALYARQDANISADSDSFAIKKRRFGGLTNLKYEYLNESPVLPYVAAGLGFGNTHYNVLGTDGAANGLLWQLKAGVSVPLSETMTLDLGYRYLRSPNYTSQSTVVIGGQTYEATYHAANGDHVVSTGLRIAF